MTRTSLAESPPDQQARGSSAHGISTPDLNSFQGSTAALRSALALDPRYNAGTMKPGDHPEFFRFAPPPGASRQSTIVLDREGRFSHDGDPIDNPKLEQALRTWIAIHPDDSRPILTNGYDWCYFGVEDAPFIVTALHDGPTPTLVLFDQTEEPLDLDTLSIGSDGVVYARVKGGKFEARFSRHAQTQLAPLLVHDDPPTVRVGAREIVLPARRLPPG